MFIYDEIYEESFYSSKVFDHYYKDSSILGEENARIGVFDIETTGLSPVNGKVILGALLSKDDKGLRVRQFFLEDESEEKELLEIYGNVLEEMDVLVSYNGNGFDLPYLKQRLKKHYLKSPFSGILSLDMYTVFNKYTSFRDIIPNLKQKTVEEFLGLKGSREDTIDGGKSVELFYRYLSEKTDDLRNVILLHNRDDVLQLSRILWAFDSLDVHRIASNTGFPIKVDHKKITVTGINIKKGSLDVGGTYSGVTGRYNIFRNDCTVSMNPENEKTLIEPESDRGEILIHIPLRCKGKTIYALAEDIDSPLSFSSEEYTHGNGSLVFKKKGEPDYRAINIFVKDMLRDILRKI